MRDALVGLTSTSASLHCLPIQSGFFKFTHMIHQSAISIRYGPSPSHYLLTGDSSVQALKSIGDNGEPCGRQECIVVGSEVQLPHLITTFRWKKAAAIQFMRKGWILSSRSWAIRKSKGTLLYTSSRSIATSHVSMRECISSYTSWANSAELPHHLYNALKVTANITLISQMAGTQHSKTSFRRIKSYHL